MQKIYKHLKKRTNKNSNLTVLVSIHTLEYCNTSYGVKSKNSLIQEQLVNKQVNSQTLYGASFL